VSNPTVPPRVDAHHRSRGAARRVLAARLEDVRAQEDKAEALSSKGVHRMRVAVRRLRAGLHVLGNGARLDKDDRRARRLQDALGTIRDLQVQRAWVRQHIERMPIGSKLAHTLDSELDLHGPKLVAAIKRWRKKDADLLARHLADTTPVRPLTGRKALQQLRLQISEVASAIQIAGDFSEAATVHQARIALKKLRYQLELVAPALPEKVNPLLEQLGPLQKALGNIHDIDVRHGRLSDEVTRATPAQRQMLVQVMERIHKERDAEAREAVRAVRPWLQNAWTRRLLAAFS
jgi:CHAD domain-containing protein